MMARTSQIGVIAEGQRNLILNLGNSNAGIGFGDLCENKIPGEPDVGVASRRDTPLFVGFARIADIRDVIPNQSIIATNQAP
jgi:hypothetical protein